MERFWNKVDKKGDDECWNWTGCKGYNGYGRFFHNKRLTGSHRASWEIHNNQKIPDGLFVLHSCDNPSCVNPAHLRVGTPLENMKDRSLRGRCGACGAGIKNKNATEKLSDEQVREIRERLKNKKRGDQAVISEEYGVSRSTITHIIKGQKRTNAY